MPLMISVRSNQRSHQRSFEAAKSGRLGSFGLGSQSFDADIRAGLRPLRGKSRWLFQNNDYAKNFARLLKVNVIGPAGIVLQNKARTADGELDKTANIAVEEGWVDWGKRGICDVTGKLSWLECLQLYITTIARDGECLVEMVEGFPNKYGFAIRFIEADHLDENLNRAQSSVPGGNVIRMGIEFDQWDRPVAYHLLKKHPGDTGSNAAFGNSFRRVPAEKIHHGFLTESIRQSRGVPMSHTTIRRLGQLDGFEEAALTAARAGASKMGFFTQNSPDIGEDGSEYDGSETEEDGSVITDFEPGILEKLPIGWDFKEFNPGYPNGDTEPFTKLQLRGACSGWGVPYHSLTGDLTDVNFSSIRQGELTARDGWKVLQAFVADGFCQTIKTAWLKNAMLNQSVALPLAQFERINVGKWFPRVWGWVDPVKDMNAFYLEAKTRSLTRMLAERGIDFYEEIDLMAAEREYADGKGIDLEAILNPRSKTNAPAATPAK
ncbi:MAG: phage portal protein [Desulfuromonas sp.]|nr:phage portal protein [Desulfuromonas sp.]